jgi:hypothetical protein
VEARGPRSGRIFGPEDNTSGQQATDVEIFTYPVGIQGPAAPEPATWG